MEIERELTSYLRTYGNTRESDLIDYGTKVLGISPENMRKTLNTMLLEGWIQMIIHNKLGVNRVYIAKGDWSDFYLDFESEAFDLKNRDKLLEDAKDILLEAEEIAEKVNA